MPWFWGGGNQNDPAKSLNADLKQFLEDQHPRPYRPTEVPLQVSEEVKLPEVPKSLPDTTKSAEERPLPRESLFQDGRYKDLWKTYVPQSELVAATSNPVDQVISARKDRRAGIHRAALENCVFEQELQRNCLGGGLSGSVKSKMTMCHAETKTFNRCYQLQAKFMQALGYLASSGTTDEEEERIQMHADKLYHRMMDYEEALEDARRNNQPIPPLSSVFDPNRPAPTVEQFGLPEHIARKLKTPLEELPPQERELAARAALREARMVEENAEDFFKYTTTMNEERQKRQASASRIFGEVIGKFLIPDPPQEPGNKRSPMEAAREVWANEGHSNRQSASTQDYGKG